jgi:hypothetical protein
MSPRKPGCDIVSVRPFESERLNDPRRPAAVVVVIKGSLNNFGEICMSSNDFCAVERH